jgi:hypothetical protein
MRHRILLLLVAAVFAADRAWAESKPAPKAETKSETKAEPKPDTLADWLKLPQAVRASRAIEAATALHEPRVTLTVNELSAHLLTCVDQAARGPDPHAEVLTTIANCIRAVRRPQ